MEINEAAEAAGGPPDVLHIHYTASTTNPPPWKISGPAGHDFVPGHKTRTNGHVVYTVFVPWVISGVCPYFVPGHKTGELCCPFLCPGAKRGSVVGTKRGWAQNEGRSKIS